MFIIGNNKRIDLDCVCYTISDKHYFRDYTLSTFTCEVESTYYLLDDTWVDYSTHLINMNIIAYLYLQKNPTRRYLVSGFLGEVV